MVQWCIMDPRGRPYDSKPRMTDGTGDLKWQCSFNGDLF